MLLSWEDKWKEAKQKLVEFVASENIPLDKVAVSFSGGKDSTLVLKMVEELGWKNKVKVVFFDTRMEYQAIYDFVEKKKQEGWIIETTYPEKPAPLIYKEFGVPCKSKKASELISRLQRHNFDFKNDTYKDREYLLNKYPKCRVAIRWLVGDYTMIKCPKWLKRRLVLGLDFKIANKCCEYLKKKPVYIYNKLNNIKLSLIGIRQAEGGVRTEHYKGCIFRDKIHNNIKFFPLFYFTNEDVVEIIKHKNIEISRAYTIYGLDRTGCVGCPFGANYKEELAILEKYEPNKAVAVKNLFKDSYEVLSWNNTKYKENEEKEEDNVKEKEKELNKF